MARGTGFILKRLFRKHPRCYCLQPDPGRLEAKPARVFHPLGSGRRRYQWTDSCQPVQLQNRSRVPAAAAPAPLDASPPAAAAAASSCSSVSTWRVGSGRWSPGRRTRECRRRLPCRAATPCAGVSRKRVAFCRQKVSTTSRPSSQVGGAAAEASPSVNRTTRTRSESLVSQYRSELPQQAGSVFYRVLIFICVVWILLRFFKSLRTQN